MRKTNQTGYIMRHRGWWVLRYRERVGVGGKIKTIQRAKRLAPVDAQHKTKASVRDLAKRELDPLNRNSAEPMSVTKLGDFVERVYPFDLNGCYQREMKDVLKRAGITWHGWHGFRRGLASNLNRLGVDDSVIQRILRHSNVATTQNHYIKTASPDAISAMRQFSEALLCSTCAPDEGVSLKGTVQ